MNGVTVDDARVTKTDIQASDGVIRDHRAGAQDVKADERVVVSSKGDERRVVIARGKSASHSFLSVLFVSMFRIYRGEV